MQNREKIFQAFQRGIKAFINQYDRINLKNPIQQVNIYTKLTYLKDQINRFEKATSNLTVPVEYRFFIHNQDQNVLYRREQKETQLDEGEQLI